MDCQLIRNIADKVSKIVRDTDFETSGTNPTPDSPLWQKVADCGTQLWLDTGDIEESAPLWNKQFEAFTTNNSLLNAEVAKGTYDGLIARTAEELQGEVPEEDMPLEISFVLNARHALRIVHQFDAYVSVELHTDLMNDAERSVAYGRRFHAICPDRFYVKVPFTPAGLLAARQLEQDGIPVNCTLGFSARHNFLIAAVAETAFCNVFLGRLNSFVANNDLGPGNMIGERATISSQQAVEGLRDVIGTKTQQIAASMRDGEQVVSLAGVDVFTMPLSVVNEFEELAPDADTLSPRTDALPEVEFAAGVDPEETGINVLWDVPDDFKKTVADLREWNLDSFSADNVREFFATRDLPGFFPDWTNEQVQTARDTGKIPDYEQWKDEMATGSASLDALMNLHAAYYFAADQKEMDDRITSML